MVRYESPVTLPGKKYRPAISPLQTMARRKFTDVCLGRGGANLWPARSPDLTPLEFWFWDDIKRRVYQIDLRHWWPLKYIKNQINEIMHDRDSSEIVSGIRGTRCFSETLHFYIIVVCKVFINLIKTINSIYKIQCLSTSWKKNYWNPLRINRNISI